MNNNVFLNFRPARLRAVLAALLLACFAVSTPAPAQPTTGFVVEAIEVEGLQRFALDTLYSYLPIDIGDNIGQPQIAAALRSLFDSGLFEDVQLFREGSTLVVVVRERPTILELTISGNDQIDDETLTEALNGVGLRAGRAFDRAVLTEVVQLLIQQYYNMGRYGVVVDAQVDELPDNQVRIRVEIQEGESARIRQINIVGNETFSDARLLGELGLGVSNWFSWLTQNDRYAQERLAADLEVVRSYYMDRGFADFQIDSVQVSISPDLAGIYITVNVTEGAQYILTEVRLSGRFPVDEAELAALITAQPGEVFSQRLLSESAEAIALRLGEDGYAFAEVRPLPPVLNRDTREASVTIFVEPRDRVYVRRIEFDGTDRINDAVLRREMRQLEGAYLSNSLVIRSIERLRQLPYLASVDIAVEPVPGSPDQVDLRVTSLYGNPGELSFGLAWSTSEEFVLQGSFTHTNFLGRGQRFTAEIDTSRYATVYSLSHTDPYTTLDGVSRTIGLSYENRGQLTAQSSDFTTRTFDALLQYAYPMSEFQNVRVGLTWQNAKLVAGGSSSSQAEDWVTFNGNTFTQTSGADTFVGTRFDSYEFSLGWLYDSRNRPLFATSGARHNISVGYALPFSDVEYVYLSYQGTQYFDLPGSFTLRLNANVFLGTELNASTSLPPNMNRFAGGPGTVRGYRQSSLGPRDSLGNPYGGNILTAAQVELLIPLPESWQQRASIALFYDIGNVFSSEWVRFYDLQGDRTYYPFDLGELRQSIGVGLEFLLAPLGVLRLSYAVPLNPFKGNARHPADQEERLQLGITTAF